MICANVIDFFVFVEYISDNINSIMISITTTSANTMFNKDITFNTCGDFCSKVFKRIDALKFIIEPCDTFGCEFVVL